MYADYNESRPLICFGFDSVTFHIWNSVLAYHNSSVFGPNVIRSNADSDDLI